MSFPGAPITSIADLRELARRRVPRMFYDYVDCGSWTGATYRANEADLGAIRLRQRVGIDISERSQATRLLGEPAAIPVALAPTGLAGMQWADGEILAARAAERFGVPFTLSTVSVCSIEDVADHTSRPFWFQLYMMKDRAFMERLVKRARDAGCSALVLTLDLPVQGQRHLDIKNGLSTPPKPTLRNIVNLASKPRWCLNMARTRRHTFRNIVGHVEGVEDMSSLAQWVSGQFDQTLNWDDVRWLRRIWDRKLVLKGILDPEDARLAARTGADAIVVSNHGGRQLDGAPSSISMLPRIAEAAGSDIEVLFDGGIRSGQDVLKALGLGARGVLIGRAFLYGLGAMGEAGVTACLDILRRELDLTMALCGITDPRDAARALLDTPTPVPPHLRAVAPA
ncbi:alpha-hydroxy acid oxidase [Xanthobacter sp. KR7-65]|uniref:alpha-hydroxy acid oxidase n=1 Tax=Xanthobacter sp. KR7-65 TaxID=3156612 RepID=UPI0032B34F5D